MALSAKLTCAVVSFISHLLRKETVGIRKDFP